MHEPQKLKLTSFLTQMFKMGSRNLSCDENETSGGQLSTPSQLNSHTSGDAWHGPPSCDWSHKDTQHRGIVCTSNAGFLTVSTSGTVHVMTKKSDVGSEREAVLWQF